MTRLFQSNSDATLFVEHDSDDRSAPVRLLFKTPAGEVRTEALTTAELTRLCRHLQVIVFERENRVVWPCDPVIVRYYERAKEQAEVRLDDFRKSRDLEAVQEEIVTWDMI